MDDDTFSDKSLSEKLSKLNSSQQSIESLSRWCISYRRKAKQIVETWESIFKTVKPDQQVSLLYLSNDILQNSRRKGSEFVNEFWKVLPAALKHCYDGGDENCRKVASRLVDIWEERKVFGSRGQILKNEVLGKDPTPIDDGKNPDPPIKVVKRDATALRIKLAVGGLPEKIITALQLVLDEIVNEETALNNCRNAVSCIREIEKDVSNVSPQGNLDGSDIVGNIQKQESMIQQCISQLENSEAIRAALISQLREALQDQESQLELIRSELLVARDQIKRAANMRHLLTSPPATVKQMMSEQQSSYSPALLANNPNLTSSFANPNNEEDNSMKATAAAVAAKLTALSSPAQMLSSIFSTLAAEEAASVSVGLKRPKLDDVAANSAYFPTAVTNLPTVQSSSSQLQAPFLPHPLPPLAPPLLPPFGFGAGNVLQPPMTGFARPGPPAQQPQPAQQQQEPGSGGYYRPVGIGFYGKSHQPPNPPIHRQ